MKSSTKVVSALNKRVNNVKIVTIDNRNITVSSIYKPLGVDFEFYEPAHFQKNEAKIVIGDFNSQSIYWGYRETNENIVRVEDWTEK